MVFGARTPKTRRDHGAAGLSRCSTVGAAGLSRVQPKLGVHLPLEPRFVEVAGQPGWHAISAPASTREPFTCIMLDMRLSARADYALRASIELAAATGGHVTADQLAKSQHIPGKFLEAILTQLGRSGLVRSRRGPDGGFWLARPASEISLADIIRAIDGPLLGVRGERPENLGYIGAAEPLQTVWIALRANERAILEEVTLAHLVADDLPESVVRLAGLPGSWE